MKKYIIILLLFLIYIGEIGIFGEWKTKLDFKAIEYLKKQQRLFNQIKQIFIMLIAISYFMIFIKIPPIKIKFLTLISYIIIGTLFLLIMLRGRIDEIPITQSRAYFSKYDIVNDITVNSVWNLANRGKLGIHDEFMFKELIQQNNKKKEPFFSVLFTLSSHSPYDKPMKNIIDWNDSENPFLNSAYYTDKCIGDFFKLAKKEKWYKNTLFILIADHSHNAYRHWAINQKEYRHIPMLFYGDVLKNKFKGYRYTKIASQTDFATTLLKQLDINTNEFSWSKNLFNPYTKQFAYFELNEGFGWISPEEYLSYEHFNNRFFQNTYKNESILKKVHRIFKYCFKSL